MSGLSGGFAPRVPPRNLGPEPPSTKPERSEERLRRNKKTGAEGAATLSGGSWGAEPPEGYMSRRAAIRASRRLAPLWASSGEEIHRWGMARETGREPGPARRSFSRGAGRPGG